MNAQLNELETEILLLESAALKREAGRLLGTPSVTVAKPSRAVESQYLSPGELYSVRQKDGSWRHEVRSAGGRTVLTGPRQTWPKWVTDILDLEEKADASRTANGRLLGYSGVAPTFR